MAKRLSKVDEGAMLQRTESGMMVSQYLGGGYLGVYFDQA